MLASSLLAVLAASGVMAVPMPSPAKAGVTTVIETLIYDQNGQLVDKKYEVKKPEAAAPAQAPVAQPAAPPAAEPAAKQQPKADPPAQKQQPKADPKPQAASAPANQLAGGSDSSAAKYVGWVEPTDPKFATIATYHHNMHRANHSAPDVTYDDELAKAAQAWAETCTSEEVVPPGSGYGMNVAFSSTADGYNPSQFISGGWYNSELMTFPGYGNNNLDVTGGDFGSWGHFSQVVWPETKKIGCGIAKCPGDATYKVHAGCMYFPAGNMMGQFAKVNKPLGHSPLYPNGQTKM